MRPVRRRPSVVPRLLCAILLLAACSPGSASGPPPGSGSPTSAGPTGPSGVGGSVDPDSAAASGDPSDCPLAGRRIDLPRSRLIDVHVIDEPASDVVEFVLADGPPGGRPRLEVSIAAPPFSSGGQAIDIEGRRFLELRFVDVETRDDAGAPTFQGSRNLEPDRPAIRRLEVFDEVDGLIAWYLGLEGHGCVSVDLVGEDRVRLIAGHGS